MDKKAIVFGADNNYKRQILATIKSICYHNRDVRFYVINNDIEEAWVNELNDKLKNIGCEISDLKITNSHIGYFQTYSHISSATFYRYYIPTLIEEDRVLYLDCDLVVNDSLDDLFDFNIDNYALAAVEDVICSYYDSNSSEFNAGVMLINNSIWKKVNVFDEAMQLHLSKDKELKNADQSVLNILFNDSWKSIDNTNNLQVGINFIKKLNNDRNVTIFDLPPKIIHFTTANKPWNSYKLRLKQKLKLFNNLSFEEVISGKLKVDYKYLWDFYDSLTFEEIERKWNKKSLN